MDSALQLALAAKASQVFGGEDKFLSFPALSPFSYPPERLSFTGADATADDLRVYREFSVAANHIARGPLYDPAAERLLPDVVRDVLDHGICAGSSLGEGDQARYQRALALLYVDPDTLPRVPSDVVRVYGRYRDAVQIAKEHLVSRMGSATNDPNPEVGERWRTIEEPLLRGQIAALEQAWESEGKRSAVEAARELERAQALHQASVTWAQWRGQFLADIDMRTDVEGISFAPTSFSPADIAATDDWQEMTLGAAEINALAESAAPELKRVFGNRPVTDIQLVKFQYRSARLERPWFPRELFESRFWRQPEGAAVISDGERLDVGSCPAYPVAVVFARAIEVTRLPATNAAPKRELLRAGHIFQLENAQALATLSTAPRPRAAAEPNFVALASAGLARDHRRRALRRGNRVRAEASAAHFAISQPVVRHASDPAPVPVAPPERVADPVSRDITILAFICRRLPRTPNPDPTLGWT